MKSKVRFEQGDFLQLGYTQIGNGGFPQRYGLYCLVLKPFDRYEVAHKYMYTVAPCDENGLAMIDHADYVNWLHVQGLIQLLHLNQIWNLGEANDLHCSYKSEGYRYHPDTELDIEYDAETGYVKKMTPKETE